MAESPQIAATEAAVPLPPVVVKKYANRRLYNTETSSYITLDNLAEMIRAGRDFAVFDAKSGEDITRGVLTQIIVEEESKGSAMLPVNFLRQLIGFYGGNLQGVVPNYLEQAMASFARQQQQMRQVMQQTFGPFMPTGVEEIGRQNMSMIERAMTMFNPFARNEAPKASGAEQTAPSDLDALRHEVESLRAQLAIARAEAVMRPALSTPMTDAIPESNPESLPMSMAESPPPPAAAPLAIASEPPRPAATRKVRGGKKG